MVILLGIALSRWLSWTILYSVFAINLILDALLLRVLWKHDARKQLPWFVAYIGWEFLSTAVGLTVWVFSRHWYTTVYWWMEGPRIALLVAAVRESLLRIFKGFESLLRRSVSVVIVIVVLYSAWKAFHAPPVQSNWLVSFILGAEFTFRWGIAGVAGLSMVLMWFVQEPMGSREDAVVTGAGLASLAVVAYVLSRSFFGTRFTFFSQYLPDVGYFVVALWWIRVFSRPVAEFGFRELGMGPEDIRRELRRYGELAEKIMQRARKP